MILIKKILYSTDIGIVAKASHERDILPFCEAFANGYGVDHPWYDTCFGPVGDVTGDYGLLYRAI